MSFADSANVTLSFLERAELKGREMESFGQCVATLQAIAKGELVVVGKHELADLRARAEAAAQPPAPHADKAAETA